MVYTSGVHCYVYKSLSSRAIHVPQNKEDRERHSNEWERNWRVAETEEEKTRESEGRGIVPAKYDSQISHEREAT